ncbi:unnamed protein product, partial [Mesorhabditis spiculigera]
MAPEQYNGLPYDGRQIDAWSLGASIYTTLNGDVLFEAPDSNDSLFRIFMEEGTFPPNEDEDIDGMDQETKNVIISLMSPVETRWSLEILLRSEWMNDPHSYTPSFPILPKWRA